MENIENTDGSNEDLDSGGGTGSGPNGPATPADDAGESDASSLASSITCQAGLTGPSNWRLLLCGTDTLDLGFYVHWGDNWPRIVEQLAKLKLRAQNTKGVELPPHVGLGLMLPSGKPPAYTFHLVLRGIQVWIARAQDPGYAPNVYVSLPSDRLWHENIGPQVAELKAWIREKGGFVERIILSRWDVAADFLLPEGLTSGFLRTHLVAKAQKRREDSKGDRLETFYVGQGTGPIQLRIYDKVAEIKANRGEKNWFFDLWGAVPTDRVWRVEWQLRRLALKQFGARDLSDLPKLAPMMWNAMTANVVSLRVPKGANVTRREVHPWWEAVHKVGELLGSEIDAERAKQKPGTASADWYIAHAAGCLVGFAARQGASELGEAAADMLQRILAYWALRDFLSAYRVHRLRLNLPLYDEQGRPDEQG